MIQTVLEKLKKYHEGVILKFDEKGQQPPRENIVLYSEIVQALAALKQLP